ncbi:DUF3343 domain-containing protein [Acidaminobacterium chupaoyuni]
MQQNFYIISFENTHTAMLAQKLLKEHYKITVVPTLREISQSCGISVILPELSREEAVSAVQSMQLEKGLYQLYFVCGAPPARTVEPIEA